MQEKLFKEDIKMGLLDDIGPAPRKVMTLFYMVDASGSMTGEKIGKVNAAMEECIPLLKEVAQATARVMCDEEGIQK